MRNPTYPASAPCEPEWSSRSLTELVAFLSQRYRRVIQERIDAVASLLQEIRLSDQERFTAYQHVAAVFRSLREAITEHVWLEDEILCPAIVKVEYDLASTHEGAREAFNEMILTVHNEHRHLRRMIDGIGQALAVITRSPGVPEEEVLPSELAELGKLLDEQLALEERCLWPRAVLLFQQST
jgi:iron-sulfur cluster repair protein YtfE (RIC family)